ncbi:RibD family protein [Polynucleobacter rarus]|uniref:RibD family protein n=1 Tax=Polynucleobacter rarus TaxID=556055 RepID=UPI001FE6913E|nr:RibD family protein [Polynucleobacter rarus]
MFSTQLASSPPASNLSLQKQQEWDEFLVNFFGNGPLSISPLQAIFEPLRNPTLDDMVVVGQIGQTLDGRIATVTGQSRYVNGLTGLTHLHQLRALVDAVVIGVGTALADDPQLTVRQIKGRNPARVVIDPRARLSHQHLVWQDDGVKKIWIVAEGVTASPPPQVELIMLPAVSGAIDPALILKSLNLHSLKRVLIEGGAETVSRFIVAKCLDRLHLIVAPIIMGSGRLSFNLPPIEHMDQALRLAIQTHQLGNDVVFDCDLQTQRVALNTK